MFMQFWVRTEMHCTQIVWKLYKMWMSVFIQFRVRIGIHGTQICQKYTCSEWAWLYASGYPLKCIAPLFPIGTRNLHSSRLWYWRTSLEKVTHLTCLNKTYIQCLRHINYIFYTTHITEYLTTLELSLSTACVYTTGTAFSFRIR